MKLKIFLSTIMLAGGVLFFLGKEDSTGFTDSTLRMANIMALSKSESGPKCPNGCKDIGWGWDKILECDCNYDHFSSCNSWGC